MALAHVRPKPGTDSLEHFEIDLFLSLLYSGELYQRLAWSKPVSAITAMRLGGDSPSRTSALYGYGIGHRGVGDGRWDAVEAPPMPSACRGEVTGSLSSCAQLPDDTSP